jgi:predicted signal transduction protein with EAL and GGDEF domain
MAHSLGHEVVAEGVETEAQLDCLQQLNCDMFQGFLLSRPVAPEQVPEMLTGPHPAFDELAGRRLCPQMRLVHSKEEALKAS